MNSASAGVAPRLSQLDALALPFASCSFERVICNPPWGRQVDFADDPAVFYRRFLSEVVRVLVPGGHCVVLTDRPELAHHPALIVRDTHTISLFGQLPTIIHWCCVKAS